MANRMRTCGLILICVAGALAVFPAPVAAKGYAFLVGVNNYEQPELPPLKFAGKDATDFGRVLRGAGFDVVVMHDDTADPSYHPDRLPSGGAIRRQLETFLGDERLGAGDEVVVALSGHGVQFAGQPAGYFCPRDALLAEPATLIGLDDLYAKLERCKAGRKLLLVDACRNDPLQAKGALKAKSKTAPKEFLGEVPEGIVALFSCKAGEESFEDDRLAHGVFFHFVIQGWNGAALLPGQDALSLDALISFVRSETARYVTTNRGGRRQQPYAKRKFNGEWVLRQDVSGSMARRKGAFDKTGEGEKAFRDDRLEDARARFEEAERLDPEDPLPAFQRGLTHARRGELDDAIRAFDEALRRDRLHAGARITRAQMYGLRGRAGDLGRALEGFEEAIAINNRVALAYTARANVLKQHKDYRRAIEDFSRALALEKIARAHKGRGLSYYRLRNYQEAANDFAESVALAPGDGEARKLLDLAKQNLHAETARDD